MIFISIGCQCTTSSCMKKNNIRNMSYPFDWILSNPFFIHKILKLLLDENMNVETIVKDHFFKCDKYVKLFKKEHYHTCKNKYILFNAKYNIVFPHDKMNNKDIDKYVRRLNRLKKDIIHSKENIKFIYVSQSSLDKGNFTIDKKHIINDVYENINKIYDLINKYNNNFDILIFDAILNEDKNILNKNIQIFELTPQISCSLLQPQLNKLFKNIF